MKTTKCRTCDAEIVFVRHISTRKLMPVDAKPVTGFIIDSSDGDVPQVTSGVVYVSHFATCPQAAQHRRER